MIDLSFLTEAEQEAILKVLNRDSVLKKAEEQRIRQLQDKGNDENELKYKSGQWFYEAKSKRHRDKIHGADLVRASIRKRKKPATIELYGVMEPPDETEEDLMSTKAESNHSAKRVNFNSPDTDKERIPNGNASPAKQRKNPFNSEDSVDATDLHNEMPNQDPQDCQVNGQERKKNVMSSIIKYGVRLPYAAPISDRQTSQEAEEDSSPKQPPVPKPRKLLINGQPPDRSNSSLQREDSNSTNKRRGILKRRSSSSSTDSESIRIPPNGEPMKLVLPTSPILEAEQPHLFDDQVTSSENSPDRQKQVRFSEKVLQKPPTPNPESYKVQEIGEFRVLDSSSSQNELDYEMVDYPHYEESKQTQYSNNLEALDQSSPEENPTVQTSLNSAQILHASKKLEDGRRGINDDRVYEILDESHREINIDSAGTQPIYAEVRKPSKSTSSDQEKDFTMEDALMEPRLLNQRGETERAYQREKTLEFGKSYGGGGKINYASHYTTNQNEKVSTNQDTLAPEKATNVRSSYDYEDEPKHHFHDSDYIPKWRRSYTLENEDLLAQPRAVQEFPNVNFREEGTFVKPYPENRTNSRYSPGEYETDTKYKSIFLRNTPEVEGRLVAPSPNFPVAQTIPLSSRPVSADYQTHETFLHGSRERGDFPKSANFKVMSLKERIHDTPREQVSNPSQFHSLKHFWNAEDKNQSKRDVATSPEKIFTDVSNRNKPTRADLKQRNSKEILANDHSLPSSFDSLSEEEQTSQKVASWLAQTPAVYGAEQLDDDDQVQPGEEVVESTDKVVIHRKNQAEEFSNILQKLTDEALEAPKITEPEHLESEDLQISPFKEPDFSDQKKNATTFSVNSAEKKPPPTKFYERVVKISNTQSPVKETNMYSIQYPGEEIEESVESTVAPAKTANEFKIGFQKLMEEYESVSTKSDSEHQVEEPNSIGKEHQLIETEESVAKSFVPKENDHQEFIAALKKMEIEASTPSIKDPDEQPEKVSMLNSASPLKSSFKIGFEHLMPDKEDTFEPTQKPSVTYTVQTSPSYHEDSNGIEEVVEKISAPSRLDENDLSAALKKLEHEAAVNDSRKEPGDSYEKPTITPSLQSARSLSIVQNFEIPRTDVQNIASPSDSLEKKSAFEDPPYSGRKSSEEAEDTSVTHAIPKRENQKYSFDGAEQLGDDEDQVQPGEEVVESIDKVVIHRKNQAEEFSNALQKLTDEALEAPKITEPEHLESADLQIFPFKEPDFSDQKKNTTTFSVNLAEKKPPPTKFYERVVQISNTQSPVKETNMYSIQYPGEEIEESVESTVAPAKTANEFKIGFQKLMEEYESVSTKSDSEHQVEEPNSTGKEHQLIETEESVDKSFVPKENNQEFIAALKKMEIEASTPSIKDQDEQPEKVSMLNSASPLKSSFKIGFEHLMPDKEDTFEPTQKPSVTYTVQTSPSYHEDSNGIEEVVEKISAPSRLDENDLSAALKKLEHEAAVNDPRKEPGDTYEKPTITPSLQSARSLSFAQNFEIPRSDVQNIASPSDSLEKKSAFEDPSYSGRKSSKEAEDTSVTNAIPKRESQKYSFDGQGKLPVEEETIEKTIIDNEESSADYKNRLMRLEEAAASVPEEPSVGDAFHVSPAPTKEVFISKKVFSNNESMPTELPFSRGMPKDLNQPQPYAYKELANYPLSPSDQSGSFTGSAENVLYKKPDTSEVSNSKQGMDESNPILRALKRSTAKKAVLEVSPTSTNQNQLNDKKGDTLSPTENSFPENAAKLKQMSQSVPAFLQDDTDGRETDSASESSFQIGRHKKSPSSLTNLSGSSGMASMSSVSGSVMSMYSGDFGNLDIKGSIEFAIDYVQELKEFHIFIYQCKDLAAADVKKQRSDPYVKAYLLPEKAKMGKRKSAVKKKTLNPVYNEILRYKIPKESLQNQTLNLSVWHHDALGRNSFLGEVNLDLAMWDWHNAQRNWYPLEARTPASGVGLLNRGEIRLSLQYIPVTSAGGKKSNSTGEVQIWIKDCTQLPMLRENKINAFVKCTILPDTSRKSRQKTRSVNKTPNPIFNHKMIYDGFKEDDLREACVELTVWDHNKLSNHFLGGIRIGLGTGKSYGTAVDWMDSSHEESAMWEKMITSPNTWIDGFLPLRMFKMAKLAK